jgi:hypothetical protein
MRIDEFNELLRSEKETGQLVESLRALSTLDDPRDVVSATREPQGQWFGWF